MTSTGTATMQYDANGNMVQKSEANNFWRYTWDQENRLTEASTRKQKMRYKYDALGRRVERNFGFKERTKFTHDRLDVVMDDDAATGITKYQNGLGIDDKFKVSSDGASNYFLQDHLGSTLGLTNSSATVTSSSSYDSFGNPTGNLATRYQFTGREYDAFSGFYYYRARFYDANLGRFISEDPIGFDGEDVNLYGYVKNNPLRFRDPKGTFPFDQIPIPIVDHSLYFYYAYMCNKEGQQCKQCIQRQFDRDPIRWATDNPGYSSPGDQMFNECLVGYYCQQMIKYSRKLWTGSFPLNPDGRTIRAVRDYNNNIRPGEVY